MSKLPEGQTGFKHLVHSVVAKVGDYCPLRAACASLTLCGKEQLWKSLAFIKGKVKPQGNICSGSISKLGSKCFPVNHWVCVNKANEREI